MNLGGSNLTQYVPVLHDISAQSEGGFQRVAPIFAEQGQSPWFVMSVHPGHAAQVVVN